MKTSEEFRIGRRQLLCIGRHFLRVRSHAKVWTVCSDLFPKMLLAAIACEVVG